MYRVLRPFLFLLPAEAAHHLGIWFASFMGFLYRISGWRWQKQKYNSQIGPVTSRLGLAAGLDKNAKALWGWESLGFGFVEVGTVTPVAQSGNPRPRLFRFTQEEALINRMGFNNDGVVAVAARVKKAKAQGLKIIVGVNIGKNKYTSLDKAADDYGICAANLRGVADYLVINVSSPNTQGLRDLQSEAELQKIIDAVKKHSGTTPVFVKVAPDHFTGFQDGIVAVVKKNGLAGVICGNTLAGHGKTEQGGMSGSPLLRRNLDLAQSYIRKGVNVIGVGGIFKPQDARTYLESGCQLIQIYTGLVYRGPGLVRKINASIS